jgi:hypothetical protein
MLAIACNFFLCVNYRFEEEEKSEDEDERNQIIQAYFILILNILAIRNKNPQEEKSSIKKEPKIN